MVCSSLGMGKLGGGELSSPRTSTLSSPSRAPPLAVGGSQPAVLHRWGSVSSPSTSHGQVPGRHAAAPLGDAGPLAISFAAMEDYYQHHGRNWNASRHGQGPGPQCEQHARLTELRAPSCFAAISTSGVIDGLRQMKAMIAAEVRHKGTGGQHQARRRGIREVEFIAQALQLIRGGREPPAGAPPARGDRRHRPGGALEGDQCERLLVAYRFLRRVENILQEIGDQQTRPLPTEGRIVSGSSPPPSASMTGPPSWPTSTRRWPPSTGSLSPWWGEKGPAHLEQLWLDLWRTELDAARTGAPADHAQVVEPRPSVRRPAAFQEGTSAVRSAPGADRPGLADAGTAAPGGGEPRACPSVRAGLHPADPHLHPQRLPATAGGKPRRPAPAGAIV